VLGAANTPRALAPLLAVVFLVSTVVVGTMFGLPLFILIVAASTLLGAIALLWASVQNLTGDAPMTLDEALSLAAPTAEEERKRAVLRALKDLEYERSVGKLSEQDYDALSRRYREEARQLLRTIDEARGSHHERLERLVEGRLTSPPKKGKKKPTSEPAKATENGPAQAAKAEEP
jgi:hypothetical protein